jgi:hypothetical protein
MQTYSNGPSRTFVEEVAGALTGKEGYLVELGSTGGVQLLTSGIPIGVVEGKLQGDSAVSVRLLGKGGTVKMIQSASVALGARLIGGSGGKVSTLTIGRSVGIKISPADSGAANDVIEVIDVVENVT